MVSYPHCAETFCESSRYATKFCSFCLFRSQHDLDSDLSLRYGVSLIWLNFCPARKLSLACLSWTWTVYIRTGCITIIWSSFLSYKQKRILWNYLVHVETGCLQILTTISVILHSFSPLKRSRYSKSCFKENSLCHFILFMQKEVFKHYLSGLKMPLRSHLHS